MFSTQSLGNQEALWFKQNVIANWTFSFKIYFWLNFFFKNQTYIAYKIIEVGFWIVWPEGCLYFFILQVRIEQVIVAEPGAVLLYKISNLLKFYHHTIRYTKLQSMLKVSFFLILCMKFNTVKRVFLWLSFCSVLWNQGEMFMISSKCHLSVVIPQFISNLLWNIVSICHRNCLFIVLC